MPREREREREPQPANEEAGFWKSTDLFIAKHVPQSRKGTFAESTYPSGEHVTNAAISVISSLNTQGKPLFLLIWYMDTHQPWLKDAPTKFTGAYHGGRLLQSRGVEGVYQLDRDIITKRLIECQGAITPDDLEVIRAIYYEAASFADSEVGRVISAVRESRHLRNTSIIVTSDHGDELGEHGAVGHGRTLFNESLRTLLAINGRDIPQGSRVPRRVANMNLYHTVLDMAGIHVAATDDPLAESLMKDARGEKSDNATVLASLDVIQKTTRSDGAESVEAGLIKKIVLPDGREVIAHQDGRYSYYNIERDPLETVKLPEDSEAQAQLTTLDAFQRRKAANDRIAPADTNIPWQLCYCGQQPAQTRTGPLDYVPPNLRALGYIAR